MIKNDRVGLVFGRLWVAIVLLPRGKVREKDLMHFSFVGGSEDTPVKVLASKFTVCI